MCLAHALLQYQTGFYGHRYYYCIAERAVWLPNSVALDALMSRECYNSISKPLNAPIFFATRKENPHNKRDKGEKNTRHMRPLRLQYKIRQEKVFSLFHPSMHRDSCIQRWGVMIHISKWAPNKIRMLIKFVCETAAVVHIRVPHSNTSSEHEQFVRAVIYIYDWL